MNKSSTTNAEDIKLISNQIFNCPIHSANVSNIQVFRSCLITETAQKMTADKYNITCPPPAHTHNEVPLNLACAGQAEVLDILMKGKSSIATIDETPSPQPVSMETGNVPASPPPSPTVSEVLATTYDTLETTDTAPPSPTPLEYLLTTDVKVGRGNYFPVVYVSENVSCESIRNTV